MTTPTPLFDAPALPALVGSEHFKLRRNTPGAIKAHGLKGHVQCEECIWTTHEAQGKPTAPPSPGHPPVVLAWHSVGAALRRPRLAVEDQAEGTCEMSSVPWATAPWSEIVPGLWQGGHVYRDGLDARAAIVWDEFDRVVSLYGKPGHGPADGVEHTEFRIPDGELDPVERQRAYDLGTVVALEVEAGKRVLVRCQAGYNRSGLIVAHALIALGHTPDAAIDLIREKRSPYALFNEAFLIYLGACCPKTNLTGQQCMRTAHADWCCNFAPAGSAQ